MAAYAALVSLMHIIDDLRNHHSPPISLNEQQVQSLTQNIMFLQEFLEGYCSPVADGDEADPLEVRIADAAYAAEDVIESHILAKIQASRPKETKIRRFINFFRGPKNPEMASSWAGANCNDETIKLYEDLQEAIDEMDLIKKEAIDTEKVVTHDQGHTFVPIASLRPSFSSSSTGKNNSSVVCSDDVVKEIMKELDSYSHQRLVIPIVGMGGIGKTFLAKTIYSEPLIQKHFVICAWAAISQQYNTREILCEILSQATNTKKEELSGMSKEELSLKLHKHLFNRRFFIVLDDMWSVDAWDEIQNYFPDNKNRSRVLVTTRISQLASQLNNNYCHHMKFLDEASSWNLFSKTVFGENNCPPELEEIGKKIVENCRGLPLSIVVVGGILRNMQPNQGYWESIRKNLTSVVNLENDKHCLRVLKLSYNHLPVYLKPCFLYMGVFEEDDRIEVSTLVKLWVCEGFLKPIDGGSMKKLAKGFIKELVDRNLILTDLVGDTGNIKLAKVHDLLRDMCLSEVKKEGFYHVVGQGSPRGISGQRRIVIRKNTPKKQVINEVQSMSHARSVICENGRVHRRCRNLGLLRTFHAYKFRTIDDRSYAIHSLKLQHVNNLQHLAVEIGSISSIFASVNLLWNLHTLIVSCSSESTAPADIWKMPQLRHIELPERTFRLPDPPSDAIVMTNLQILKGVKNFKCSHEVVKRIPNIKKLEVKYSGREGMKHDNYYCLTNINCLSKLESLRVNSWPTFRGNSLQKFTFPDSLRSLSLELINVGCEKVLERIGWLPNLEKFKLWMGCFGTGKWKVADGQFRSLKFLGLYASFNLKEWTAEGEGVSIFPCLEQLLLLYLPKLEEIPSQIGDIPTLQLILMHCNDSAVIRMKEVVDYQLEQYGGPDQLPFRVQAKLLHKNEALLSLADPPHFKVLE